MLQIATFAYSYKHASAYSRWSGQLNVACLTADVILELRERPSFDDIYF